MDVIFVCPNCRQELEADASLAGSQIACPTCNNNIAIPAPDPQNIRTHNPIASSAAAREEKHFVVPVRDQPTEVLIQKAARPLEVAARDEDKKIRVKTIRRTDCIEVGHDRFDEVVTEFLAGRSTVALARRNGLAVRTVEEILREGTRRKAGRK